jgi:hypothetical protein
MVSHFLFEAEFCNRASGWEKGQIEKNVQDARHRLWQPTPSFPSVAALNDWLGNALQRHRHNGDVTLTPTWQEAV